MSFDNIINQYCFIGFFFLFTGARTCYTLMSEKLHTVYANMHLCACLTTYTSLIIYNLIINLNRFQMHVLNYLFQSRRPNLAYRTVNLVQAEYIILPGAC